MIIILSGYKSCGKTTVAKAYSKLYGIKFIDTDLLMLLAHHHSGPNKGKTISELYKSLGEEDFRALESEVIHQLKPGESAIIATGGGAVLDDSNVRILKSLGKIIYLKLNYEENIKRLLSTSPTPSFISKTNKGQALERYFKSRDSIYIKTSDFIIDVSFQSVDEIVSTIHDKFK